MNDQPRDAIPGSGDHGHRPANARSLSVSEVAARLGTSTQHVRGLCREGRLEAFRSGDGRGSWLVHESSLDAYLDEHPVRRREDDVFVELELASERVRSATLAEQLAQRTAELQISLARVAELERRLADESARTAALVRAQESLLTGFRAGNI